MAAVDATGQVRATSGRGVFGGYASAMFVTTDPGWCRRGIGQAMTSAAPRAARASGAVHAGLDASDLGRRITGGSGSKRRPRSRASIEHRRASGLISDST
jgi:hypothetical protein